MLPSPFPLVGILGPRLYFVFIPVFLLLYPLASAVLFFFPCRACATSSRAPSLFILVRALITDLVRVCRSGKQYLYASRPQDLCAHACQLPVESSFPLYLGTLRSLNIAELQHNQINIDLPRWIG